MPKTAPVPECSEEDREVLKNWAHSRTMEARLVERARIVLGCLEGKPVSAVADSLNVRPNTVIDWRRRFEAEGIAGLQDRPRSGKPPQYTEEFRKQVLSTKHNHRAPRIRSRKQCHHRSLLPYPSVRAAAEAIDPSGNGARVYLPAGPRCRECGFHRSLS